MGRHHGNFLTKTIMNIHVHIITSKMIIFSDAQVHYHSEQLHYYHWWKSTATIYLSIKFLIWLPLIKLATSTFLVREKVIL